MKTFINQPTVQTDNISYDLFISYSHKTDRDNAVGLQSLIKGIGLSVWSRRKRRIFRDETDLGTTPHLWPDILERLKQSRYFLLIASPDSAVSPWVKKELVAWLTDFAVSDWDENEDLPVPVGSIVGHKRDSLLLCLTRGEIVWSANDPDFDWTLTDALPQLLQGVFTQIPKWERIAPQPKSGRASLITSAAGIAAKLDGVTPAAILAEDAKVLRRRLSFALAAMGGILGLLLYVSILWQKQEVLTAAEKKAKEDTQAANLQVREQLSHALYSAAGTKIPSLEKKLGSLQKSQVPSDQRDREAAALLCQALRLNPRNYNAAATLTGLVTGKRWAQTLQTIPHEGVLADAQPKLINGGSRVNAFR